MQGGSGCVASRVLRAVLSLVALTLACTACVRSPEEWRAGLQEPDPFERGMSALALARVAPADCAEAIPRLLELVDLPDARLAAAGRAELARVAHLQAESLVYYLTEVPDSSPEFRSALRAALVAAGAPAVEPLRARLVASGASNPREIGQLLADIGASAVEPMLADLRDAESRRRLCAAWVLGRLGPGAKSAVPALAELLERDELAVARQAALSLADVAPLEESTRATLTAAQARRGGELASPLREALARLALQRAAQGVREECERMLFALGSEAFGPASESCAGPEELRRAAGERHLHLTYCALALGLPLERSGSESDPARLQERLDDQDPATRAHAALEIALLGARGLPFAQALASHLRDPHPGVALSARYALLQVLRACALALQRSRK